MRKVISAGIGLFLFSAVLSSSTFVNDDCDALRKENEQLKQELVKAQNEAERAMKMADAANQEAKKQASIAAENARLAQRQSEEARSFAEKAQQEVNRQKMMAEQNALEAQRQQKIAEECAKKKN